MRPLEWLLAVLAVSGSIALFARQRSPIIAWVFCAAALTLVAAQVWFEGPHWQLFPLYAALALIALFFIRRPDSSLAAGLTALILIAATLAFSWVLPMFRLPPPTGTFAVGTRTLYLKDASRGRELVTQVWYPAEPVGQLARYVRPREIRPIGRYQAQIRTNSYQDAPIAASGGAFPVLLFGHRWGGRRTQDTFLMEDLASHGYVVASVDHPGNAALVELSDGRVIPSSMADAISMNHSPSQVEATWNTELAAWTADNQFALNALAAATEDHASWAYGRLDMTRVGAIGHSFGGAASMRLLGTDSRVKCAVNMDGWTFGGLASRTTQPILYLYGVPPAQQDPRPEAPPTTQSNDDQLDRLDRNIVSESLRRYGGWKGYVQGAQHADFTDETLVSPLQRVTYTGPIPGRRMREMTRSLVLGFLDQTLRGTGTVPDFPEIRWIDKGKH